MALRWQKALHDTMRSKYAQAAGQAGGAPSGGGGGGGVPSGGGGGGGGSESPRFTGGGAHDDSDLLAELDRLRRMLQEREDAIKALDAGGDVMAKLEHMSSQHFSVKKKAVGVQTTGEEEEDEGEEEEGGGKGGYRRGKAPKKRAARKEQPDASEDEVPHRKKRPPMISTLENAKKMAAWMVHKAAGSMMQVGADFDSMEMASSMDGEGDQDFGEFVEDRFLELYGLKHVSCEHLRDTLAGVFHASESHVRLATFRKLSGLVPGDKPLPGQGGMFYRLAIKQLVEVTCSDHMSDLRGDAFWTRFCKTDVIRVPIIFYERTAEKLEKLVKSLHATAEPEARDAKVRRANSIVFATRMSAAFSAALARSKEIIILNADLAGVKAKAEYDAKLEASGGKRRKGDEGPKLAAVFEVGPKIDWKGTIRDPKLAKLAAKHGAYRLDVDCYLALALDLFSASELEEHRRLQKAFASWDLNGDGKLQFAEFSALIQCASPPS